MCLTSRSASSSGGVHRDRELAGRGPDHAAGRRALGGVDFSDWYLQLTNRDQTYPSLQAARAAGAAVIAFGSFLNAVIKFVIVAFAVFLLVKQVTAATACSRNPCNGAGSRPVFVTG